MAAENLATGFQTILAENSGQFISAAATAFNVKDRKPSGLSVPFRARIKTPNSSVAGEVVIVTDVDESAPTHGVWTATRGQETTLGALAAQRWNDGAIVETVITATGVANAVANQAAASVAGDTTYDAATHGPVLVDLSDGHTYRIVSTAGLLSTVLVT